MRIGERGFAFITVLVALFVVGVMLLAAAEPAAVVAQREREEELVFRGEAYVEAIRLYQSEHGGAFPTQLKQLLEQGPKRRRYIRQLYRNPFDPEGKWALLAPGVTPPKGVPGLGGTPAAPPPVGVPLTPTQGGPRVGLLPGPGQALPFRLDGQEGQPIVGVYCNSKRQAFREYRGRKNYDEWYFSPLVIPPPPPVGVGLGQGAVPAPAGPPPAAPQGPKS